MNARRIALSAAALSAVLLPPALLRAAAAEPPSTRVPGVVIDHLPASSGTYVGSPSLAVLPDGDYVASHDHFGPKSTEYGAARTSVFRSGDRGRTWRKVSEVRGAFWSNLFVHRGALYLFGPEKNYGRIVLRRSDDGGATWTVPTNRTTGLLTEEDQYHTAPMPVLEHDGRLWRAFERREPALGWGVNYRAGMLSAPIGADLLDASSWTLSEFVRSNRSWNGDDMGGWLEGNAVVTPGGEIVDLLRVQTASPDEKAALVRIGADGRRAAFDPATGLIGFPGGAKKFTVRFDPKSRQYWSLASIVHEHYRAPNPGGIRNTLALTCSPDLTNWTVRCILLHHPDVRRHGFQYVDWLFDGDDLIAACRTAYDDDEGGAHSAHDANYLTFHRIANFRAKTMDDSVPVAPPPPPPPPPVLAKPADVVVTGHGWTLEALNNDAQAFGNRTYVWKELPKPFRGGRFTRTEGGVRGGIRVTARTAGTLYAATTVSQAGSALNGWTALPDCEFHYTDGGNTRLAVCSRAVKAGEEIELPQVNWCGTLLLVPPGGNAEARPAPSPADAALERLRYHHPGLVTDLGVGLWAWPLPMDFDGDGDLDLVVNCPDKPYNGVYFFENAAGDTAKHKMPVFKPARRISKGLQNVQVSYVDGKPRVLSPATEHPDFLKTGLEDGVKLPLPANLHTNKVRANMWRWVDYDGDGTLDLSVGVGDWTDYKWDNAYTPDGVWTNGPLRGFVYVVRNRGTTAKPDWAPPFKVEAAGKPVEVFGWPSPNFADFDGDGDLDLLCGEFLDGFTYFENAGTRAAPRYAPGRRMKTADGRPLAMDLQMITPTAIDWDRDGDLDLVVGDEDGRVALVENAGGLADDRTPRFLPPRYFRQEAEELKCGALATPVGCDWDGDGDTDIVSGNTAGYVEFFENLSGRGVAKPKWAAPVRLEAGGSVLRIMAGPNGSIQGPCEAKWGYTTLSVADWDGDELQDLVVNSILGKVVWYRNTGTRTAPRLAAAQPVEVEWDGPPPVLGYGWLRPEGKALLTQWRTTPVVYDWNRDGLPDLVMLDTEGCLAFFERAIRDGRRVLLPPRRAFCDEKGEPLHLATGIAGRSGRRKICIADWDGDGRPDLLLNAANAKFLRQVEARDGRWLFKDMGLLVEQNIEGHDVSPTVVDFDGNGIPDFLGGAEDGRFYYLRNPRAQ